VRLPSASLFLFRRSELFCALYSASAWKRRNRKLTYYHCGFIAGWWMASKSHARPQRELATFCPFWSLTG